MPRSSDISFVCSCGTTFNTTIYQVVNVTLEPRLLYRLLARQLNVAVCPNCGRRTESAQPFIYHDMRRGLLAYVSPQTEASEDEREELLNHLRRVYSHAVEESERIVARRARANQAGGAPRPTVRRSRPYDDIQATFEPDAPPMQVIFGVEQLEALVESLLEPEEKLSRIALYARNAGQAERERLASVARALAEQAQCEASVDEDDGGATVWIYGPRGRINALAKALNTPVA